MSRAHPYRVKGVIVFSVCEPPFLQGPFLVLVDGSKLSLWFVWGGLAICQERLACFRHYTDLNAAGVGDRLEASATPKSEMYQPQAMMKRS